MGRQAATIAVAVLGSAFLLSCGDDSGDRPAVPRAELTRDCSQRVEGRLPDDWRSRSVVAGPIAFYAGANLQHQKDGQRNALNGEKVLAVVELGRSATVAVPAGERRYVALTYDPTAWKGLYARGPRLTDGQRTVRFVACPSDQRSFSGRRLPHTQFNGGFIVRWPHCARLAVYYNGDRAEAAIPFGRSCQRG